MQINRLFEIIYILLDKKRVTAGELAEHFDVSRRTICRDIDTLSIAGIPIYTERGRGGGIRLLSNFVLDKSILSDQDQNEILSVLYGLVSIKPDDTNQILQRLSSIFGKTVANWLEVDFSGWSHENDYFDNFKTAILEQRITEFDYYNSYGNKKFRRIEPIQVCFKSKSWYLKGYCLTKQELRLYKVSRIKNLIVTYETFAKRDPNILTNNPTSHIYKKSHMVKMKFHIQPEKAYRVFDDFYENMVEKQPDGSFIVTVLWPEDDWLYGFLLSFGKYIEVLEPERIRNQLRDEVQEMSKRYL